MELTTERLILRDFTADDHEALAAYQREPRYLEFYEPEAGGPDRTRELLDMFLAWSVERPRLNFQLAIVEPAVSPAPIGCGGVRCKGLEAGVAELGIELAPGCWGRGLATEAAGALLTFASRELGVRAVIATSVTQNHRIARVLRKLGFRPIGTRAGPDWMQARGFSETAWRITAGDQAPL